MKFGFAAILAAATVCASIAPQPAMARMPAAVAAPDQKARLQAALDRIAAKQKLPGATAAVLFEDGSIFTLATGQADREAGQAMPTDAVMPAASIGKTFVSAWALALEQEGRLDLDAPISRWLGQEPWFARLPNGPEITTRMLLNHSSGLIDHAWTQEWLVNYFGKTKADPDHIFPPAELVSYALDRKPLFAAGKGYAYSDTNYVLAGMIFEKITGRAYIDEIRDRFWTPLGLTRVVGNARRAPGLVNGYLMEKNELGIPEKSFVDGAIFTNPNVEFTGGGVMSTSGDLARWAMALYGGKALPKPYLDELVAPNPAQKPSGSRYGLGVTMVETKVGAALGHSGTMPYYGSMMAYLPDRHMAVAIMANRMTFDRKAALEALVAATAP